MRSPRARRSLSDVISCWRPAKSSHILFSCETYRDFAVEPHPARATASITAAAPACMRRARLKLDNLDTFPRTCGRSPSGITASWAGCTPRSRPVPVPPHPVSAPSAPAGSLFTALIRPLGGQAPGAARALQDRPLASGGRLVRPALLRELDRAGLPDHGHLDLAGVLELILDLARDLVREQDGTVVVDLLRLDDHADLAARLERVDLLHPVVPRGDLLERLEPLDVLLEALAARAGPRRRDGVRRDHEDRFDRLRLDLVVVGLDRVHDRGRLAIPACVLCREQRVRAFDLVCERLPDVVQERCALSRLHARLQLRRHDPREMDDLERVLEDVLPVAGAVAEPSEDLDELLVDVAAVRLEDGLLAGLADEVVDLGLRLVVHLLDPRGMDAAVLDQLAQRQLRDLAADPVERRQDDGLRRVVDDHVHPGQVLESADIAAFPPDDPALHVV